MKRSPRTTHADGDESSCALKKLKDAASLLKRLNAPCGDIDAAQQLVRRALDARACGDTEALEGILISGQPFIDLCSLLAGGTQAMQRDPALIGRLEKAYPQIAWFIRAQIQLRHDESGFADLTDVMITDMYTLRDSSPLCQYDDGKALARGPIRMREPPVTVYSSSQGSTRSQSDRSVSQDACSRFELNAQELDSILRGAQGEPGKHLADEVRSALGNARSYDWDRLIASYPEITALPELRSALCNSPDADLHCRIAAQIRRAIAQCNGLAFAIDYARRCTSNAPADARNENTFVHERLFGASGHLSRAVCAIIERDSTCYGYVRALCRRLFSSETARTVNMNAFCDMIRAVFREAALSEPQPDTILDWFALAYPYLFALSLWHAVAFIE